MNETLKPEVARENARIEKISAAAWSRAMQVTHIRTSATTTRCGRTIAGSMELDNLAPTCPTCAAESFDFSTPVEDRIDPRATEAASEADRFARRYRGRRPA